MNKFLLLIISLFISLNVFAQADSELKTDNIEVAVGIDKVIKLDFSPGRNAELGKPSLLKVVINAKRKEVLFQGLRQGTTSITFRNSLGERAQRYIVTVTATNLSKKVQDLRELIGDVEGLEISIKGGKIAVGGQIVVPTDVGKIEAVLGADEDVLRLYELSPLTQAMIAKKMQEEMVRNSMKNVTVRVVNKVYWVEGVVASESQRQLIEKIVQGYLPVGVKGLYLGTDRADAGNGRPAYQLFLTVNAKKQKKPPEKLIKISAQFVELAKDYAKVFAFKWAPLMSEDGSQIAFGRTNDGEVSTNSSGGLSGIISNLFPKLQSAKNAGYARIIQSGMVVVKNDKKGTINKTTTTPFAVGTSEFTRAQTASTTFSLDVQPRVVEEEKVEMSLGVSIALPSGQTSQGNPVTTSNKLNTEVVVKSKQSAVIGGIVQNQTITQFDKDDPAPLNVESGSPLFFFLRSKSYVTAKNQFVIFVTPEIIESASVGTEEIRKKFRRRTR